MTADTTRDAETIDDIYQLAATKRTQAQDISDQVETQAPKSTLSLKYEFISKVEEKNQ